MSIERIDHVVIAVRDLEQAIAHYRALGFTVYPGGEHPGGYSHNALVIFADGAYFELIAYMRERPGFRWWDLLRGQGEGLVDYALLPTEVERDFEAARARGLPLEFADGGRTRLDGAQLAWKTARAETTDMPFLCGDVTPRALRVPEGEVRAHANGATGVASVTVAVADLAASVTRYRALLGRTPTATSALAGLGIALATFELSGAQIHLASPAGAGPSGDQLRARLASHGDSPLAVALRTEGAATPGSLDLQLTHGAPIELVPTWP